MKVIIEVAKPEQAQEICSVHKRTWLNTYPDKQHGVTVEGIEDLYLDGPERVKLRESYIKNCGTENQTLVALSGSEIVGFCVGAKFAGYNKLRSLYVLPEFHGQGIGKKLLAAISEWFGIPKDCFLGVAVYNQKAIDFYRRQGFVSTGVNREFATRPHGVKIPELIMRKDKSKFEEDV